MAFCVAPPPPRPSDTIFAIGQPSLAGYYRRFVCKDDGLHSNRTVRGNSSRFSGLSSSNASVSKLSIKRHTKETTAYSANAPHAVPEVQLAPIDNLVVVKMVCILTDFEWDATHNDLIAKEAAADFGTAKPDPLSSRISQFADACWRFLRPHTIRGTVLGSVALVSRALIENSHLINWWLLPKALCGLIALLCGNGYIVGINQIYDIGIDKVNKPFLPIAAGDLSVTEAWFLVLLFAAVGVAIVGINFGHFITALYCIGLFLGTIYSVPPFRMKRFPVAAFLIIATVRGFLLNFGVYYATRAALGLSFQWSPSIVFITIFVTLFAMVIAITKDLPDVEGDRKFQISTLATKLGVRKIAFLGSGILFANYFGAILASAYMPQAFRCRLMIFGHAILTLTLLYQTWVLDCSSYTKEAIAKFYRFIWYLFYAEYAMFPFI